jgi:1-acyl-sn-glycerol-3-phosphate acyltransferase
MVFYPLLKFYARLAIRIYCKEIIINHKEFLEMEGPVLFAANHPNSFLDGIILTTLHHYPVHSLARGDVFKKKWSNSFLRKMQLLPVYRTSEGVENLEHNYTTFASCIETFQKNGIVLIFSEGRCENEWHLRPLKKGTARLANAAWQKGIPLKIIPVGFNYSSFRKFGKEVHLLFGKVITKDMVNGTESEGKLHLDFNSLLETQLKELVYEIDENDDNKRRSVFNIHMTNSFFLLLLPGLAGFILHAPLYLPVKWLTERRFRKSGHYDSVITTALFFSYPPYVLLLVMLAFPFWGLYGLGLFLLLPLLAWCAVQLKYQLDL